MTKKLKRHEAAGLSAAKIAPLLGTTRSAVLGRSNRLRGKLLESDVKRYELQRRKAVPRNYWNVQQAKIFAALRADLAAGFDRDTVIKRALDARIGHTAIGDFFGLSLAQVYLGETSRNGPRNKSNSWCRCGPIIPLRK